MIGDRFGPRRVIIVVCLALGVFGALRGFANSFIVLVGTNLLSGFLVSVMPITLHKACGMWFSGRRLGFANGFVAAGMATGSMIGSLISATVLSPRLGGWRQVMFFYGGISGIMAIPWLLIKTIPGEKQGISDAGRFASVRTSLSTVVGIREVWLLGLVFLGVGGCVTGTLGYLPLYLREMGWIPAWADAALGLFHAMSLVAVFPITMMSDRTGSRMNILMAAALMVMVGVGLLGISNGWLVWGAVLIAGIARDGFMALMITQVTELIGIGARYAATAIGLSLTIGRLGDWLTPPIGNSLATWNSRLPFLFWALMAFLGFWMLTILRKGLFD